jgi:hypothetical protein
MAVQKPGRTTLMTRLRHISVIERKSGSETLDPRRHCITGKCVARVRLGMGRTPRVIYWHRSSLLRAQQVSEYTEYHQICVADLLDMIEPHAGVFDRIGEWPVLFVDMTNYWHCRPRIASGTRMPIEQLPREEIQNGKSPGHFAQA